MQHLRAALQLAALEDDEPIEEISARARALAREACSPALTWIADRAEAVRAHRLQRAFDATAALDAYGEHYTAARLPVDALVRMPTPTRRPTRSRDWSGWARSPALRSSARIHR